MYIKEIDNHDARQGIAGKMLMAQDDITLQADIFLRK